MLIYTHKITERLKYATAIIFEHILTTPFELTDDVNEFNKSELPKISYNESCNGSVVFIKSHSLLFDTTIKKIIPEADLEFVDFPLFFKSSTNDFLGYDIFAAVFYFASRYE